MMKGKPEIARDYTPERWRQIDRTLEEALEYDAGGRASFLEAVCAGDEVLRREVEALLAAHERTSGILESPAMDAAAKALAKEQESALPRDVIGRRLVSYEVLALAGRGGMGEVYRARDTRLDRIVAMKILPAHLSGDPNLRQRFELEARVISKLNHPHICTLYDVGRQDGIDFLVMEYLEGETLADRLRIGMLPLEQVLLHAVAVSEALDYAHRHGIIHRDLKPANVMLTPFGAKLMDFGLAKLWNPKAVQSEISMGSTREASLTDVETILGTASYMSPEQTTGERLDHRADIWSLGVLLYEIATGQVPFQGHYAQAVFDSILHDPPPSITALRAGIPLELERIVNKCLAKRAEERYQTVNDLSADLKVLKRSLGSGGGRRSPSNTTDTRLSIAVLPLENHSREDEDEYFSNGIIEDITSALVKLERLRVAPRSVAFQFKGKRPAPQEAGQKLNVDYLLEGSMRRSGNRLRINVALIAIDEGYEIWSEKYDCVMEDIFEIQDEISQAIVEKLRIKLAANERELLTKRYTENLQAYNLCLRGRYYWSKRTVDGLRKAVTCFEQALAEDPDYALAHAGFADSYTLLGFYGSMPAKQAMPRAEAAASKALQVEPELAAAYVSRAAVESFFHWNWAAAERDFQHGIELDPSYAVGHLWYAILALLPVGRLDEALSVWRRAADLDPITPLFNNADSFILTLQRQYDEAIEAVQKVLELDPNFPWAHLNAGRSYVLKGDYEKGIAALERSEVPQFREGHLGFAYALSGQPEKARNLIQKLREGLRPTYLLPYHLAMIHFGLGENDQAFALLDDAYSQRSQQLWWIKVIPELDAVRSDPRFKDLLRRMNLPD